MRETEFGRTPEYSRMRRQRLEASEQQEPAVIVHQGQDGSTLMLVRSEPGVYTTARPLRRGELGDKQHAVVARKPKGGYVLLKRNQGDAYQVVRTAEREDEAVVVDTLMGKPVLLLGDEEGTMQPVTLFDRIDVGAIMDQGANSTAPLTITCLGAVRRNEEANAAGAGAGRTSAAGAGLGVHGRPSFNSIGSFGSARTREPTADGISAADAQTQGDEGRAPRDMYVFQLVRERNVLFRLQTCTSPAVLPSDLTVVLPTQREPLHLQLLGEDTYVRVETDDLGDDAVPVVLPASSFREVLSKVIAPEPTIGGVAESETRRLVTLLKQERTHERYVVMEKHPGGKYRRARLGPGRSGSGSGGGGAGRLADTSSRVTVETQDGRYLDLHRADDGYTQVDAGGGTFDRSGGGGADESLTELHSTAFDGGYVSLLRSDDGVYAILCKETEDDPVYVRADTGTEYMTADELQRYSRTSSLANVDAGVPPIVGPRAAPLQAWSPESRPNARSSNGRNSSGNGGANDFVQYMARRSVSPAPPAQQQQQQRGRPTYEAAASARRTAGMQQQLTQQVMQTQMAHPGTGSLGGMGGMGDLYHARARGDGHSGGGGGRAVYGHRFSTAEGDGGAGFLARRSNMRPSMESQQLYGYVEVSGEDDEGGERPGSGGARGGRYGPGGSGRSASRHGAPPSFVPRHSVINEEAGDERPQQHHSAAAAFGGVVVDAQQNSSSRYNNRFGDGNMRSSSNSSSGAGHLAQHQPSSDVDAVEAQQLLQRGSTHNGSFVLQRVNDRSVWLHLLANGVVHILQLDVDPRATAVRPLTGDKFVVPSVQAFIKLYSRPQPPNAPVPTQLMYDLTPRKP